MTRWCFPAMLVALLACSQALAEPAPEAIGHVAEVRGVAIAYTGTGERRRLGSGSEVYRGETLITGRGALSKIRFRDGAFFMLGENAQFRAESYTVSENPDQAKSFYRLLKGGLRFVSGLIAKARPDNFEIRTSVATIGVRGSSGEIHMQESGDLHVHTESGMLMATLPSGRQIPIAQGQGWSQRPGQPANQPSSGRPDAMPKDSPLSGENLQASVNQANQLLPPVAGPQPVSPSNRVPVSSQNGRDSAPLPGGGATGAELTSPDS